MSKQADIEFLFILALENYTKTNNLTYEECTEIFHRNHIMEKMLVQHEYLHQIALEEVFDFVNKNISKNTGLILYHGSDSFFEKIDLEKSQNRRDFGKGFYTTVLEEQARNWAYKQMLRNGKTESYVYKFSFEESQDLNIKHFDSLNMEWLEFIKLNRSKGGIQHDFDVVIGPVADDNTMQTVQLYLLGTIKADEAVERLKYNDVNNQVSFHTEKAVEKLVLLNRSVLPCTAANTEFYRSVYARESFYI